MGAALLDEGVDLLAGADSEGVDLLAGVPPAEPDFRAHPEGIIEEFIAAPIARGVLALRRESSMMTVLRSARDLDMHQAAERGEDLKDFNLPPIKAAEFRGYSPERRSELRDASTANLLKAIGEVSERTKSLQAMPQDPDLEKALNAETIEEFWEHFKKKPFKFIASVGVESLPQMLPGIAMAIPGGMVGGVPLAAAGLGAGSGLVDYAASTMEALVKRKVDLTDEAAIRRALEDPALMEEVKTIAFKHAAPVAIFDAVSLAAIARKLGGMFVTRMLKQTGIQSTLGAGGEAIGQHAAGEGISFGQIAAEAAGELAQAPIEAGVAGIAQATKPSVAKAAGKKAPEIVERIEPTLGTEQVAVDLLRPEQAQLIAQLTEEIGLAQEAAPAAVQQHAVAPVEIPTPPETVSPPAQAAPGEVVAEAPIAEEPAEPAPRRERPRKRPPAFMSVDASRDTLTTAIAKLGGISAGEAMDISGESKAVRAPHAPMRFVIRRQGGQSMDAARERLVELGYITEQTSLVELQDMIREELGGQKDHLSQWAEEGVLDQRAQRDEELQDEAVRFAESAGIEDLEPTLPPEDFGDLGDFVPAGEAALTGEKVAVTELMARASLADEAAVERLAIQSEGMSEKDFATALQEIVDANKQTVEAGRAGVAEVPPALTLTGETEGERAAREAAARDRERAIEDEARVAEERARADLERADFDLTGSERAADANKDQGNLYNLRYRKVIERTTEESPKRRIFIGSELKKAVARYDKVVGRSPLLAGHMLSDDVEALVDRIVEAKEPNFKPRVRGPDWVKERLLRARRLGELDERAADLALWFIDKNPAVATDLGISLKKGGGLSAGQYNPQARIITLMKDAENPDTAAHEILHHTERMMPEDVRDGITSEWLRQFSRAYRNASAEERPIMKAIAASAAGEPGARAELKKMMEDERFPYELYQFTNPSEFWAVNGARILSARHTASQAGWVAKARQWLREFLEKVKGLLRIPSDAPVIRGLENALATEGGVITTQMLAREKSFLSPDGTLYALGKDVSQPPTPQAKFQFIENGARELKARKGRRRDGTWQDDIGQFKRFVVTPRTIAAFEEEFVPVYQSALGQWKYRDKLIAVFEREADPYFKASREDQAVVNKILEHDRLTGQIALAGTNKTVHFTSTEAALSKPGERVTVTDGQKASYWAARRMLDQALNEFRDQTLEDFGLPRGLTSGQVLAMVEPAKPKAENARLVRVAAQVKEIEDSRRRGYVPFSRYGDVGLVVRDPATNTVAHYEMIEVGYFARKMARGELLTMTPVRERYEALKKRYPKLEVEAPFQVAKGGAPSDVRLQQIDALAEIAKIDNPTWDAIRAELEKAIAEKGFRQHFFRSQNTPGYGTDFERSLANYITGISGYLARRRYAGDWANAIREIPPTMPRLRDYANEYQRYINSPQEEYSFLRGANFVYYLTSIAAWAINATQVPFVSMPWTAQYVNPAKVAAAFTRAEVEAALMFRPVGQGFQMFDPAKAPADLRAQMQQAFDDGMFVPITTYETMAIGQNRARRELRALPKAGRLAMELFGYGFTGVERLNRVSTFIALYRLARDNPQVQQNFSRQMTENALARPLIEKWSPFDFAEFGIDETHFRPGKVNRQRIARNIGTVIFQFKSTYLANWLELQVRFMLLHGNAGRAASLTMLTIVGLMAGVWGLPGADDLRKLWEAYWRYIKKQPKDADLELRKTIVEMGGSVEAAEAVSGGITRLLPEPWNVDLSKRIGVGKILPHEPGEVLGVSYDLWGKRPIQAMEQFELDNMLLGLAEIMPKLAQDFATALSWARQGVRTRADVPVIPPEEVSAGMLAAKAVGFTPGRLAEVRARERAETVTETAADMKRRQFYSRYAKAAAAEERAAMEGDLIAGAAAEALLEDIEKEIDAWNKDQPEHMQINLKSATTRAKISKEFEGASRDKGKRRQARDEIERLQRLYNTQREARQ